MCIRDSSGERRRSRPPTPELHVFLRPRDGVEIVRRRRRIRRRIRQKSLLILIILYYWYSYYYS